MDSFLIRADSLKMMMKQYIKPFTKGFRSLEEVNDIREKKPFTINRMNEFASSGTYYFKTNDLTFIDGRETAPSSAKIDMFMKDDGTVMSFMEAVPSGKAVGTPGIVALYETAHKAYGLLPWNVLFKDAIDLANNGFIVSPRLASYVELAEKRGRLSKNPLTKKYL